MRPLALVAAVARNGVIGRDGDLPWRLPDELKHFKATTLGHCLILGRRTWESLPGALPERTVIVVTRNRAYRAEGALLADGLETALLLADEQGDDEPRVAGGAELYAQALPQATRLWLTRVHADVEGDVRFPNWDESSWQLAHSRDHTADERHAYAFTIEEWRRR
ncbi:MAG: dihydrofolate reductase [Myxococcota bacterium]|nr:dihydrofolate reductase [Myxococcota bacterium]